MSFEGFAVNIKLSEPNTIVSHSSWLLPLSRLCRNALDSAAQADGCIASSGEHRACYPVDACLETDRNAANKSSILAKPSKGSVTVVFKAAFAGGL